MTPIGNQDSGTSDRLSNIDLSVLGASSALKAGLVYFAIVFAIGFVLGMIRVPFLAPLLGDLMAVLIELPIIMTSAWLICWKIVRSFEVPPAIGLRLLMGGVALVVLLIAEFALSTLVFGNSIINHIRSYLSAPHALGLVGQFAFGLFPTIQIKLTCDADVAVTSHNNAVNGSRR
ncbi:MAG: hypothetical protein ACK49R_18690 [Planctomycetota bacterium]|jgi:hypothetical protein